MLRCHARILCGLGAELYKIEKASTPAPSENGPEGEVFSRLITRCFPKVVASKRCVDFESHWASNGVVSPLIGGSGHTALSHSLEIAVGIVGHNVSLAATVDLEPVIVPYEVLNCM